MPSSEVCRSLERVSRATLTIVVSRTDMIAPRITTIAMRQSLGFIAGEVPFVPESLATELFGIKRLALEPPLYPWTDMASQRSVTVGGVQIGGGAPVVVQTMTKTETANLQATMDQIRRVAEAGADIVRVAVPR